MADIAEEVARFWGYDRIEYSDIRGVEVEGGYSPLQIFRKSLGEICRAAGYTEVITYSFVSPSAWDKIRVSADSPLRDACSAEAASSRTFRHLLSNTLGISFMAR